MNCRRGSVCRGHFGSQLFFSSECKVEATDSSHYSCKLWCIQKRTGLRIGSIFYLFIYLFIYLKKNCLLQALVKIYRNTKSKFLNKINGELLSYCPHALDRGLAQF